MERDDGRYVCADCGAERRYADRYLRMRPDVAAIGHRQGASQVSVRGEHRLKVPLIWVEGRMKKKNPSSGIGLPKRIESAGFAF